MTTRGGTFLSGCSATRHGACRGSRLAVHWARPERTRKRDASWRSFSADVEHSPACITRMACFAAALSWDGMALGAASTSTSTIRCPISFKGFGPRSIAGLRLSRTKEHRHGHGCSLSR